MQLIWASQHWHDVIACSVGRQCSRRGWLVAPNGSLQLGIASADQVRGGLHGAKELGAVSGQALCVGLALGCTSTSRIC